MEKKIITIIDQIGRTIIGELVAQTETKLDIKNPVILHVQPTPSGQLNIQTIPLYFREFLGPKCKEAGTVWSFPTNSIVIGNDIDNEERLLKAYDNIWAPIPTTPVQNDKVIKLFDE
jgi:hypothetical protein